MFPKKTKPAAVAFPTLAEVDPGLSALLDKRATLRTELRDLSREADDLRAALHDERAVTQIGADVAGLLGDLVEAPPASARLRRLEEIERQTNARAAALRILADRIHEAEILASRKVRAVAAPVYLDRLAVLARALMAVIEADQELRKVVAAIEDTGASWAGQDGLEAVDPRVREIAIRVVKRAVEVKALPPVEVPEGLLHE